MLKMTPRAQVPDFLRGPRRLSVHSLRLKAVESKVAKTATLELHGSGSFRQLGAQMHEHVVNGNAGALGERIRVNGGMIGPGECLGVTDVDGLLIADLDDRMTRAHGADDAIERAIDQDFGAAHGRAWVAVSVADGQRSDPRRLFSNVVAAVADAVTGIDTDDAGDACAQPERGSQVGEGFVAGAGGVGAVERESGSRDVESYVRAKEQSMRRRRVQSTRPDATAAQLVDERAEAVDLLGVELVALGELCERTFDAGMLCARERLDGGHRILVWRAHPAHAAVDVDVDVDGMTDGSGDGRERLIRVTAQPRQPHVLPGQRGAGLDIRTAHEEDRLADAGSAQRQRLGRLHDRQTVDDVDGIEDLTDAR